MRNRSRDVGEVRRLVGAAGALSLGVVGCLGAGDTPAVRDAARPHADAILADAPALLPQVPVAATSATRGQTGGEVQPGVMP